MGKKSAAEVVGANLDRLMSEAGLSNVTLESRLSRRVTKSTIGRMRNAEISAGIDNVEEVARAFGLEAWQFLIPDVSTEHKPRLAGSTPLEGGPTSLTTAESELLTLFNQLDDVYRALLLADAKKYLQVQQPAVKSSTTKRASSS
ncbi:hypothetical protein HMPREF3137_08745 [Achromobacter xylosoxidans]|nr:hypothetical protein HMPREF3137_08745 [Achromobacter xylosoxidans]